MNQIIHTTNNCGGTLQQQMDLEYSVKNVMSWGMWHIYTDVLKHGYKIKITWDGDMAVFHTYYMVGGIKVLNRRVKL